MRLILPILVGLAAVAGFLRAIWLQVEIKEDQRRPWRDRWRS